MRLTSDKAFIRYVGANHESDYSRLDDWVKRIKAWRKEGLNELYLFNSKKEAIDFHLALNQFFLFNNT